MTLHTTSSNADWKELATLPRALGGHTLATLNEQIFVLGGTYFDELEKSLSDEIFGYDSKNDRWDSVSNTNERPIPAYSIAATSNSDTCILLGGLIKKAATESAVHINKSGRVMQQSWGLPDSLIYASGSRFGDLAIVSGGSKSADDLSQITNETFSLSLIDGSYRQLAPNPLNARCLCATTANQKSLFLFAGAAYEADSVINKPESAAYDVSSDTWRKLTDYPIPVRGAAAVTLNENSLYIAGGYDSSKGDFTNEAYVYHVTENSYQRARNIPYSAMVSLGKTEGYIYCVGGEDKAKHRSDATFRINIASILSSLS
ncbi:MAG TPA: hypothetical protein DCX06_02650 [Opitutae bacterium]|nr:hypothetical protein [Opitutae bacterium]